MKKLWERSETAFAVLLIVVYVVGNSLLDRASDSLGIEMVLTLPFDAALIAAMLAFVNRNGLREYYGVCAPKVSARQMLFYLPALLVCTVNIWFGIVPRKGFAEGLVYFLAMIATGIAEELIFRGFLFRAMSRRSVASAVALTSVLFGAGHVVNLVNGSGMGVFENLCQLCYAASVGFLFAAVLLRGKSLIPCMTAHALFNALSVFANEPAQEKYQVPISASLCVISAAAGFYYLKEEEQNNRRKPT